MPVKPENVTDGLTSGAPTMRTYSALGILKNATEQPWPKIGFVSPDVYGTIRSYPWNDFHKDTDLNFYTLLPHDEYEGDEKLASSTSDQMEDAKITRKVSDWLWSNRNPYIYEPKPAKSAEDEYVRANNRLGHLRRYILIVKADHAPADAYAAHFYHGEWYYIARDDHISQKNFNLISLFLTMMAAPSATPPLSPTISVGGM